jgi:hypothetical protein
MVKLEFRAKTNLSSSTAKVYRQIWGIWRWFKWFTSILKQQKGLMYHQI